MVDGISKKFEFFLKFSLGPKSENFLGKKSYLGMEDKISYHDHNFSRSSFQRVKVAQSTQLVEHYKILEAQPKSKSHREGVFLSGCASYMI